MTGYGWAGDERTGVSATVVACSGPASLNVQMIGTTGAA
ncbi:DUF6758 family protein [Hamadaea sp. NPDC051192]